MSDGHTYMYVTVRYVHNLSRCEFINIGIIMWLPDQQQILYKFHRGTERARAFFRTLDPDNLLSLIDGIESRCKEAKDRLSKYGRFKGHAGTPQYLPEITAQILANGDATVHRSEYGVGTVADPKARLDKLCEEMCG